MSAPQSILSKYPAYEAVIGIEVHVQLKTKTKIFCNCANEVGKEPNSNICPICAGYPGVLPVLNKQAVEYAIMAGIATNCSIAQQSAFDRKHYFYPDLPKGYQITQQYYPICKEGFIPIRLQDSTVKNVRLTRIHMEEDAGKNIHASGSNESFVDLNRAGTPLLEMVSYPDMADSYEARAYLKALHSIVQYLGISTANMEEGAFRADTNISVRKKGDPKLGTKCELKNINSFKFIGDAIEYEIERQINLLEDGGSVSQETRLWDTKLHQTFVMRTKEEAADYRYFEDPDLPFIELNEPMINRIAATVPELPHQKFDRLCERYNLSPYEAEILVDDAALARYFEQAYDHHQSKQILNWILRDVLGYLKDKKISLVEFKITPATLAKLITLLESGKINSQAAKQVFEIVAQTGQDPERVVEEENLEQIGSVDELEELVKKIVAAHPDNVAKYKAGNERIFGFFVGQAMKETQGKANPQIINELLKKYLK